jgi:hypothetical protein
VRGVLRFEPMRRVAFVLCLAAALPAFAQKEVFFGPPGTEVLFKEQDIDRRFKKSKLGKALNAGTDNPACVQLIGGLLTALAEVGPYIHRRDENFTLDPTLLEALGTQLSTPAFPASAYLLAMVRRVLIDRKLPDEWLELAKKINPAVRIIDLGKLRMMNEGIKPIDSFLFSLPALRERYIEEVLSANSAVTSDVEASFKDDYVPRDIAWGGARLVDAGLRKKTKKAKFDPNEIQELIAILEWLPPDPNDRELNLLAKAATKPPPIRIFARLLPRQYLDLERLPIGKRLIVKGRFWKMDDSVTEVEVKDALLFEDRDWSRGVILGMPEVIAQCPLAVNELTGVAPVQPGGFHH